MSAFLYGVALQWRLDIRSRSLLITCYAVPLVFFVFMGGVFTSINPQAKDTLIQSMTVMGVSMGAFIGLPPSLVELYASEKRKIYRANGVPLSLGAVTTCLSAMIHLLLMAGILCAAAPILFDAAFPTNLAGYFCSLAAFLAVSLSVGCVLGLLVKNQARLTMISQLIFLPSIMLSGIMFPSEMLPKPLQLLGDAFPAAWGYRLLLGEGPFWENLGPLAGILAVMVLLCWILLRRMKLR